MQKKFPAKKEITKKFVKKGEKEEKKYEKKESKGDGFKYSQEIRDVIEQSILDKASMIKWEDLIGLDSIKNRMLEAIVLPIRNPKLFCGALTPPKGILMFGPPGNGKTMVAKAIAWQCGEDVTFFNMSAGGLTSRWYGDSEKLVDALFDLATMYQPSVIFLDEIDSILGARSTGENEASRRLKTQFLVKFDGVGTKAEDRVVLVGATNRPFDLDDAVLRRFTSKIFLPLPGLEARTQMITKQLATFKNSLTEKDIQSVAKRTEGYSFADLKAVIQEVALGPTREISYSVLLVIQKDDIPSATIVHFEKALKAVPKSVSEKSIEDFKKWEEENRIK